MRVITLGLTSCSWSWAEAVADLDCVGEERSLSSSCRLIVKWLFSTAKWDFCFISYLHLSPCVAWYWPPPGALQYKHCQHNHPSHLRQHTSHHICTSRHIPHTSHLTPHTLYLKPNTHHTSHTPTNITLCPFNILKRKVSFSS